MKKILIVSYTFPPSNVSGAFRVGKFAKWELVNNKLTFTIKADRFLRNMVRAIVGTLLDVGFGKIIAADVAKIIAAKDRSKSGVSVPAHALFLIEVKYPNKIRT